CQQHAASPLTF
nr:immunoglobulin light chain junction region [Macaca mulatta]